MIYHDNVISAPAANDSDLFAEFYFSGLNFSVEA